MNSKSTPYATSTKPHVSALAVALVFLFIGMALPQPAAAQLCLNPPLHADIPGYSAGASESDVWNTLSFLEGPPYRADPPELFMVGANLGYKDGCVYAGAGVGVGGAHVGLGPGGERDSNGDGVGDDWLNYWEDIAGRTLDVLVDSDLDGLLNIHEFRWELYPICVGSLPDNPTTPLIDETGLSALNCKDYDDDNWMDGPEVAYWNNIANDGLLAPGGVALFDPDRTLDSNDDGEWNIREADSDGDNLLDGNEIPVGAYPEFQDSDCALVSTECTPSWDTTYWDTTRLGQPGTGDHITDAAELAYWNTVSPTAWMTDYDGDGIESNLLDPDSDNDGVLDGEEILAGRKPYDPSDGVENTVTQNDPTNEDLPEELMDPTNLQYLRDGRVDAEAEAEELVTVVDQAISAAIAGDVTEALAIVYEATPLAPLLPSPVETAELAEEALLALVKCVDTQAAPGAPDETVTDAAQCARSVLVPFLDALLGRTVEELPLVGDTVAQLRQETLPGIVDTVDRIAPLELQATTEALLDDPVGATQDAVLDAVDLVSNPESLEEAVTQSYAAAQVEAAGLVPASTRHPQFLYDTIVQEGLDEHWPEIQEQNDNVAGATGVEPIAVVDSIAFNLYTNRSGDEAITRVPVGQRTCIQLSNTDTSTRDASGCDLYAMLTVDQGVAGNPGGAPSPGKRVTPSLQLETALPTASFELEALGYMQLPDSPHILVLGYATTGSGQPHTWTGTLLEYDANQAWSDRSIAYASTYDDTRTAIPLHLVAGSFEVEVSEPGKPVVEGEQTVLELESPGVPSSVSVDTRRFEAGGEHRVEASIDANGAADWSILHFDGLGDHESRLHVTATSLPSGTSRVTEATSGNTAASWQWTSPSATDALQATYQEKLLRIPVRVFDATATDAPANLLVRADTQTHTHAYQATAAPTTFDLLVAEGVDACPGLTERFLVVEQGASTLCITADLDGYTALQAQDLDNRFHVTGTRTTASTAATTVLVHDGNTAYAALPASPASWTGAFTSNPGNVRTLDWSASQDLASLDLQADLADELLRVELTDVPTTISATLDAAQGRGELSASDFVGSLEWVTSTTGTAPSAASLADHVRLRERTAGVEASWSLQDVQDVVARVTEDGAWEATGSFDSPRALEVYYEDEANRIQLEAASVGGDFRFRIADDANAGLFSYSHDLAAPTPSVQLVGVLGGSNVLVDATGAPSDVVLTTRLDAQSVTLDASGTVGTLEAVYAPDGQYPTSSESSFVVVAGTAAPRPGLHVKIADASMLDVTRSPGSLTLDSTTPSNPPLLLRFEQQESATVLDLDAVPAQASIVHGEGALTWSSSSPSTSFDYLARGASASSFLAASAVDAPESLTVSWTPRAADTFQALLSHSAVSLASLVVEDHRSVGGQSVGEAGFRFEGTSLPAQVAARFEPVQGRLTATATDASGASSAAGFLDVGFGERRLTRLQAPSSTGLLAFLDETSAGIAGALRASDLESLTVRLFGDEGQPDSAGTVNVQRASSGAVYVRADSASRDAHGIVHYTSAPADVEALLWPGSGAGGFRVESHSPATAGALTAKLVRDGRSLTASTAFPTPADMVASWAPGAAVQVTASSPAVLKVQATPQDASVPGHASWDHVVAKQGAGGSLFALHLSGVTSFTLDAALGVVDAATGGGVPLLVDHAPGAERLRLKADPLPASLLASWNPATRSIDVDASASMTRFLISTDPGDGGGQRLLGILDGVPAGITTFTATPDGVFSLDAPAALSRARVTSDAGTGAAAVLDGDGVRVQASGEQPAFFLNVPGLKRADLVLPAGGAPRLELVRELFASGVPAEVRIGLPGQRLMSSLDDVPGGSFVLSWPSATAMEFSATRGPSQGITLGYDAGSERGQVRVTGMRTWSLGFTEAGGIDYDASGSGSDLEAFGAWHGAAFSLEADDVSGDLVVSPASGLQSGTVTATGGDVDRLRLALASSGGSGAAAVPSVDSTGRDVFAVDTTTGGGLLSVDLPGVESLAWALPDSVGRVTGTPLTVDVQRSLASTRAAVVQAVHPDHQSFASFPDGLPADLDMDLTRNTAKWTLGVGSGGKDYVFQHQGGDAGSLRVESAGAPGSSTLSFEPKATRSLDYSASGGASRVVVQSRWNGGFVDADLTGAPSAFRVDSGGSTLEDGVVSTLASGSVGRAKLLVVPNGEDSANRVNPNWEHIAVETTGKTPYLGLNLAGFTDAMWQIPEATGNRPVVGSINRATGVPGNTWVVLSGPREDVTAKAVDSSPALSFAITPSTNTAGNLNPQPLRVVLECGLGTVSRLDLTHIHAETGQLASAAVDGCQSRTVIEGTGAEPMQIDVDSGIAPSHVAFQTTDGGTALVLDVEAPAPRLHAEVERGTCGATVPFTGSISTLGTGVTGPARILLGDEGRAPVPLDSDRPAVHAECVEGRAHVGLSVPSLQVSQWSTATAMDCSASYRFDAFQQSGDYSVTTPRGNLVVEASLESQSHGTIGFEFTNGDGILHSAPGRFGVLREDVTLPSCMEFMTSVDRVALDGAGVAGDLVVNLNPQVNGAGELFDTITVESIARVATESLEVTAHVLPVNNEGRFRSQLRFLSPFGSLDTHVLDGGAKRIPMGLHTDRIAAVFNDGLNYQTHFTDLARFDGDVNHECGRNDQVRVEYELMAGRPRHDFTAFVDMGTWGAWCDKQRLDIEAFPSSFTYTIDWQHILDNQIIMQPSDSIERFQWWRWVHSVGDVGVTAAPFYWYIGVEDLPAGTIDGGVRLGKAGKISFEPSGGPVSRFEAGISLAAGSDWYVSMGLNDASFSFEWDLDGDTRHGGNPRYFFLDTGGSLEAGMRLRFGNVGIGVASPSLSATDWQLKWGWNFLLFPTFKVAGTLTVLSPQIEVMLPDQQWRKVPSFLL